MGENVTSTQAVPHEAFLPKLQSAADFKASKQQHSPWQEKKKSKTFLFTFLKCIFSSSNYKTINGQCIISEKNTVWKHPCYFVSKYKTSTNKLLQSSKKSISFCCFFWLIFAFFYLVLFLLNKTQSSHWVSKLWQSSPSFYFAKDPGTCKPRSGCLEGSCRPEGFQLELKPGLGRPQGRPRSAQTLMTKSDTSVN